MGQRRLRLGRGATGVVPEPSFLLASRFGSKLSAECPPTPCSMRRIDEMVRAEAISPEVLVPAPADQVYVDADKEG